MATTKFHVFKDLNGKKELLFPWIMTYTNYYL